MTETAGFVLFSWVSKIAFLSLIFAIVYLGYEKLLRNADANIASHMRMIYSLLPLAISITSTLLIFVPGFSGLLVFEHCHELVCTAHSPDIVSSSLMHSGLMIIALATVFIAGWFMLQSLMKAKNWLQRLEYLANRESFASVENQYEYKVVESEDVFAWCAGIWRPNIYVSRGLINQVTTQQLESILAHEQCHIERRDNLRKFIVKWVTLFWPPSIRSQMAANFTTDLENVSNQYVQQGQQESSTIITSRTQIAKTVSLHTALQFVLVLLSVTLITSLSHFVLEWLAK